MRNRVVLPQPDGPKREINSPFWISRVTSVSAVTLRPASLWNLIPTPFTLISGSTNPRVEFRISISLSQMQKKGDDAPEWGIIATVPTRLHGIK